MTLKSLIRSKKFWTLVAAVVAALASFFVAGCGAAGMVRRSGLHCDSVEMIHYYRSKDFVAYDSSR